jgi:hypothetical protein
MTINNGALPNAATPDLDRASVSREVGTSGASGSASTDPTATEDRITLSNGNELIQKALTAPSADRSNRIQQLKNLIQTNQYNVDPVTVGRALVDAQLSGV